MQSLTYRTASYKYDRLFPHQRPVHPGIACCACAHLFECRAQATDSRHAGAVDGMRSIRIASRGIELGLQVHRRSTASKSLVEPAAVANAMLKLTDNSARRQHDLAMTFSANLQRDRISRWCLPKECDRCGPRRQRQLRLQRHHRQVSKSQADSGPRFYRHRSRCKWW